MLVVFNGKSLDGILADAKSLFGDEEIIVVTRDNDAMPVPAGLTAVPVSEFHPVWPGQPKYTVVANGGTTAQLVPVLCALLERELAGEGGVVIYDLQREGPKVLWPRM